MPRTVARVIRWSFVSGAIITVRLPLGMMKEWPRKLEYVIRYLEKIVGKSENRNPKTENEEQINSASSYHKRNSRE